MPMLPPRHPRTAPLRRVSGRVRIVAGQLRGSRLDVPDAPGLRPTPDRVRETVFNWLAPWTEGARVLDLFAGTGALGIEALSRGAAEVIFVERDAALADALRMNLERLKQPQGYVVRGDGLAEIAALDGSFDIIFLDPPFAAGLWCAAAEALEAHGRLQTGTFIYVEAPTSTSLALPPDWQPYREGRAGAVHFVLYRHGVGIR